MAIKTFPYSAEGVNSLDRVMVTALEPSLQLKNDHLLPGLDRESGLLTRSIQCQPTTFRGESIEKDRQIHRTLVASGRTCIGEPQLVSRSVHTARQVYVNTKVSSLNPFKVLTNADPR